MSKTKRGGKKAPAVTYYVTQTDDEGSRTILSGYSSALAAATACAGLPDCEWIDAAEFAASWDANAPEGGASYTIGADC